MKTKSTILAALVLVALTGCGEMSPENPTDIRPTPATSEEMQESAIKTAEEDLDFLPHSRESLITSLEFDGYSTEVSTSAVDSLKVDWKAQAEAEAKDYLVTKQELEDWLKEDGFTPEQIAYALEKPDLTPTNPVSSEPIETTAPEALEEDPPPPTSTSLDGTTINGKGESAAGAAEIAVAYSYFSRSGLIDYLVDADGFTTEEATEAVDSLEVDWNEQAEKKAQQHMFMDDLDNDQLKIMLELDGFTPEQVQAGLAAAGFWVFGPYPA